MSTPRALGISGRIAKAFLNSKLTPLVTVASLAVGVLGILATPREEEPQISVPMIDVIAAMPGASPQEAENLLARPIEQRMMELPGVDHVYTMSGDGYAMVTVRFKVGEDQERSVTKVQAKLAGAVKNKSLPLILVCQSGARSARAVATAKTLGFEQAQSLGGGLAAWKSANLPVEKA